MSQSSFELRPIQHLTVDNAIALRGKSPRPIPTFALLVSLKPIEEALID
jgi:hypothetical protein